MRKSRSCGRSVTIMRAACGGMRVHSWPHPQSWLRAASKEDVLYTLYDYSFMLARKTGAY